LISATCYFTSSRFDEAIIAEWAACIYPKFAVKLQLPCQPHIEHWRANWQPCIRQVNTVHSELDILRDITKRFDDAGFDYMLTGSFALNYYSEPRMTRDIDIVVALDPKDADSVFALFENDYYVPRNAVMRALANQTLFNVIHSESIFKVDCIIRKNTEYRRMEFERRQRVEVDGIHIWIVSKEDLIISKLLWAQDSHSDFQLRDVRNLLKTGYDAGYLKKWIRKLLLDELLRECLDE